ncbi:MAG: hypothetical protein ACSHXZ_11450 [Gammaproteobacteria bacterium]
MDDTKPLVSKKPSSDNDTSSMTAPVSLTAWERLEASITRLSTRNNFWHRLCSFVWFPFAYKSGIAIREVSTDEYVAILPFKRGNRNFYNAMAGAALLGNSEVAAGIFLFKNCGSEYEVVCKDFAYKFLRPCYGAARYNIKNASAVKEALHDQVASGKEFNIKVEMQIFQHLEKKQRQFPIGRCELSFHCTPKQIVKERKKRRKARLSNG